MSEAQKNDPPTPPVPAAQAAEEQRAADKQRDRVRCLPLGLPVLFQASEVHRTKTVRGGETLEGSVFHPELVHFAGIIGRIHDDGTADIALIIPNHSDLRWVANVPEGDGPGCFLPI